MKLVEKPAVYEFECFRLDVGNRLLLRDGEVVPVTSKVFDILLFLVENRGRLLEKDEVMQRVWEGSFVEEGNLTRNVSTLRKALGEDPKEHQYIVTVPGHGYKFVAPVRSVQETAPPLVITEQSVSTTVIEEELSLTGEASASRTLPEAPETGAAINYFQKNRKAIFFLATSVCLALALLIGFALLRTNKPVPATNHSPKSIAVLPLKPLNAENRDPVYELGIADSLILKLSGVKEIIVRPLSATRKYTSLDQDPLAAGREQQVDYVLTSNYQLADGKIRLTAQLVNVKDGSVASIFKCDEKCTNIFDTEDAISEKVGRLLLNRLSAEQNSLLAKRYTSNEDAYQFYLQGKYFLDKRDDVADFYKAIDAFEEAIKLDPNYALAYTGLAWAHRSLSFFGHEMPGGESRKAKDAVMRALTIDDSLAETYSALGEIQDNYDWNFTAGEQSHKRALELNPNSSEVHIKYGIHLMHIGRLDEAIAEFKLAIELEPTSLLSNHLLGDALYRLRRYDEAIAQFKRIVAIDASYGIANQIIWRSYVMKGDYEQAFAWYMRFLRQKGVSDRELQAVKTAYMKLGWRGILQRTIEHLQQARKDGVHNDSELALLYTQLGDREQAFRCLEKAYENRESWLVASVSDPEFDPLRSDPRFDDLLHRVGLK